MFKHLLDFGGKLSRLQFGKVFQQGFLFLGETGGRLNQYLYDLVPFPMAPQGRDPFAFETKHLAWLCPFWDVQRLFSCQGWHADVSAQRCLNKGYGNLADDVMVVPLEKLVWFHVDEYIQVSGRSTPGTALPFACQSEP